MTESELILRLSKKYIWWEKPEDMLSRPNRVLVQVMDLGTQEDVQLMVSVVGLDRLKTVLAGSGPGQLSAENWVFWHRYFGLDVPAMPVRTYG